MLREDQTAIKKCLKTMGLPLQLNDPGQGVEGKFIKGGEQQLESFLLPRAHRNNNGKLSWIKNLFYLLKHPCWIYGNTIKRDAVCTLLDVQNTILAEKNASIFRQWTWDHQLDLVKYFERLMGFENSLTKKGVQAV